MSFISPNTIVNDHFKILNSRVFYRDFVNVPILNPVGANEPQISFTRSSTATRINSSGFIETVGIDVPRFDFDPVTRICRGLLIEESRTNILYRTTDPSLWNINAGIIRDVNHAISPDGTVNAVRLRNTPNVNSFTSLGGGAALADGIYTRSIYVKPNGPNATIIFESIGNTTGSGGFLIFDAVNRTFGGETGTTISHGFQDVGNGWLRVFLVIEKSPTKMIGANIYIGGYGNSPLQHDVLLYGPQIESGRFITSYIPNSGTSTLTRAVDHCTLPSTEFNKIYNYAEGSFFFEGRGGNETTQNGYSRFIAYGASQTILSTEGPGTSIGAWSGVGPPWLVLAVPSDPRNVFGRYMMGYTTNSRKIVGQGSGVASVGNGLGTTASSFDLAFGGNINNQSSNKLNGHISQVAYYNRILSDEMFRKMTA